MIRVSNKFILKHYMYLQNFCFDDTMTPKEFIYRLVTNYCYLYTVMSNIYNDEIVIKHKENLTFEEIVNITLTYYPQISINDIFTSVFEYIESNQFSVCIENDNYLIKEFDVNAPSYYSYDLNFFGYKNLFDFIEASKISIIV
jgi:hypothetical protein